MVVRSRRRTTRALITIAVFFGLFTAAGGRVALAEPVEFKVQLYIEGLDRPTHLAWVPGTERFFVSEQWAGRIRIINHGKLLSRPCVTLNVGTQNDQGLTGLALHPHFADNHYLYAYYTNANPERNRLSRFTVEEGRCVDETPILWGLRVGLPWHQGGEMVFDDEGKLFLTTGERNIRELAQNLDSLMGKVLRLNDDGTIPADNPFLDDDENPTLVWSYGHRNSFGLEYIEDLDILIETENGPMCDDEINIIEKGQNYGWGPEYSCYLEPELGYKGVGPNPVDPIFHWDDTVAPTDAWWYEGALDVLSGALYVGDYNRSQIHRFDFVDEEPNEEFEEGEPIEVEEETIYNFNKPEHRIISLTNGPGGWLYLVGRDNIYRLVPGDSEEVKLVEDPGFSFSPAVADVGVGGFVRWQRDALADDEHVVVQSHGLFRSGQPTIEPIDFTATFSAGRFPYLCNVHDDQGMTGVVRVPPRVRQGPADLPFAVWWATKTTTTGDEFDVDYKVDDGTWQRWKTNTPARRGVFGRGGAPVDLETGREYSFRVRSGKNGVNSNWSPIATEVL
jgi:glucose/arabinose dehydrogenase